MNPDTECILKAEFRDASKSDVITNSPYAKKIGNKIS